MDPIVIGFPVAIALVVSGYVAWRFFFSERARLKRALRQATAVPIASAREGQIAKLVGKARLAEPPLAAPLTGRPCAYFQVLVEQEKKSDDSSYWTKLIDEHEHHRSLWIEDPSGRARVELDPCKVVLTLDARFRSGFLDDATPTLERFLERHGKSSRGWVFNKSLRYREGAIEEGEEIAVLGRCRLEPDPDPTAAATGYRDRPMLLTVGAPPGEALILSDDPRTLY